MLKKLVKLLSILLLFLTLSFSWYYPNYAEKFSRLLDVKLQKIRDVNKQKQFLKDLYIKLIKIKKQIAKKYRSSKTFIQKQKYKTIYWVLLDWQRVIKGKYNHLPKANVERVNKEGNQNTKEKIILSQKTRSLKEEDVSKKEIEEVLLRLHQKLLSEIGFKKLDNILDELRREGFMIEKGYLSGYLISKEGQVNQMAVRGGINMNQLVYLKDGDKSLIKGSIFGDLESKIATNEGRIKFFLKGDLVSDNGKTAIKVNKFNYSGKGGYMSQILSDSEIIDGIRNLYKLSQKYGYLQLGSGNDFGKYLRKKMIFKEIMEDFLAKPLLIPYKKEKNAYLLVPNRYLCDLKYFDRSNGCTDSKYEKFIKDFISGECKLLISKVGKGKYKIFLSCDLSKDRRTKISDFYGIIDSNGDIEKIKIDFFGKTSRDGGWIKIFYQKNKKLNVDIYDYENMNGKEKPVLKVKIGNTNGLNYTGNFMSDNSTYRKKELIYGKVIGKLGDGIQINGIYEKRNNKYKFLFRRTKDNFLFNSNSNGLVWYDVILNVGDKLFLLSGSFLVGGFDIKIRGSYQLDNKHIDGFVKCNYGDIKFLDFSINGKLEKWNNDFVLSGFVNLYGILGVVLYNRYLNEQQMIYRIYYKLKDNRIGNRVYETSKLKVHINGWIDFVLAFKGIIRLLNQFNITYPQKVKIINFR